MPNTQSIGLGEMVISRDPQDVLVAYGLGSCVGVGMYDPTARVAGMVHHPDPCSVSDEHPAIIGTKSGLRASPTMHAPRCLNLRALIASPHNLKLNGVQLPKCCFLTSAPSTKKVNGV